MTDEVANLVLEQLRLLRSDIQRIDGKVDTLAEDVSELRGALSGVAYWTAHNTNEVLAVKERLDRLEAQPGE